MATLWNSFVSAHWFFQNWSTKEFRTFLEKSQCLFIISGQLVNDKAKFASKCLCLWHEQWTLLKFSPISGKCAVSYWNWLVTFAIQFVNAFLFALQEQHQQHLWQLAQLSPPPVPQQVSQTTFSKHWLIFRQWGNISNISTVAPFFYLRSHYGHESWNCTASNNGVKKTIHCMEDVFRYAGISAIDVSWLFEMAGKY